MKKGNYNVTGGIISQVIEAGKVSIVDVASPKTIGVGSGSPPPPQFSVQTGSGSQFSVQTGPPPDKTSISKVSVELLHSSVTRRSAI